MPRDLFPRWCYHPSWQSRLTITLFNESRCRDLHYKWPGLKGAWWSLWKASLQLRIENQLVSTLATPSQQVANLCLEYHQVNNILQWQYNEIYIMCYIPGRFSITRIVHYEHLSIPAFFSFWLASQSSFRILFCSVGLSLPSLHLYFTLGTWKKWRPVNSSQNK